MVRLTRALFNNPTVQKTKKKKIIKKNKTKSHHMQIDYAFYWTI